MALKTSAETREILEQLRRASGGIRPNMWARAAIGLSLSLETEPDAGPFDSEGTELQESALLGADAPLFHALVRQHADRVVEPDDMTPLLKRHVERGIKVIAAEFKRLNRRGDELVLSLLDRAVSVSKHVVGGDAQAHMSRNGGFAVRIELGKALDSGEPIYHTLNARGVSPHIAIMGRSGSGKTITATGYFRQIADEMERTVPVLFFDYAKGDVAGNPSFVDALGAHVVRLPGEQIPLAPLIAAKDTHEIALAAHRFRDTVNAVVRLGPKQQSRCLRIVEDAYQRAIGGPPDLADLEHVATQLYEEEGWEDDSLLAVLREFASFPIFRPSIQGTQHEIFRRSHVVDLHRLPEGLRKLAVFAMLDRLYSEIMAIREEPADLDSAGNRRVRLIIAIDEAHHYLPCKQPTLANMIREVRSKGVAIVLLSQSPDDFDQPKYNFVREMGLTLVLNCMVERPRMLEAVLGGKLDSTRMARLPEGVGVTRVPGMDEPAEIKLPIPRP